MNETLIIDAKQRLVILGFRSQDPASPVVCAEPSPDALVAQAAALSSQTSLPLGKSGEKTFQNGFAAGVSESAANIGVRTQAIQVLRYGYYRLCEGYMNGVISADEYRVVIQNSDTAIVTMMAIDALGGTTRSPLVGITPNKVTTNIADNGTPSVTIEADGNAPVSDRSGTLNKEAAENIYKVVDAYLKHVQTSGRYNLNYQ